MRTIFFLLLLSPGVLKTQTSPAQIPRFTIKTNMGPLVNFFKQAYAFGADIRLAPQITADISAGAFFNSTIYANQKEESYRGPRFRAGVKYYMIRKEKYGFHLGLEGKYQDIRHESIQQVFRQGQQYRQYLIVERTIQTIGAAARVGWQLYAGKAKRFLIEPYAGIGLMTHQVERKLPPDAEIIREFESFTFEYAPGTITMPDLLLGVHLGIALW